jgi:mono/diheme cytochrome c family protein
MTATVSDPKTGPERPVDPPATAPVVAATLPTTAPVAAAVSAQPTTPAANPPPSLPAPAPATSQAGDGNVQADPVLQRGLSVYARQCAVCHGPKGLGDGLASYLLYPKPRDFSQGQFRLTSVTSGLPTDEDILRTLRRGMPGSAMPSWAHLPEPDLKALATTVRHLAVQGRVEGMMQRNKSLTPAKALKTAQAVLAPGSPIQVPPEPKGADLDPALGKATYLQSCAACHGEDGTGKTKGDLKDASGFPVSARDFTKGVFKGSPEDLELARRITGGMPGSPMPASALPARELWSLVHHIQGMVKPGAQERVAQRQLTIPAARVAPGEALPLAPDDAGWSRAQPVFVPLMPLWWRDQRVEGVNVQAVHDGHDLVVRLTWQDPVGNDLPTMPQAFTDGAALQFSSEADPPFFGMGGGVEGGGVVNIWHWKASWQRDLRDGSASLGSMRDTYPNLPSADTDAFGNPRSDTYFTARASGNPLAQPARPSAVESLVARGMGTLTSALAAATSVKGNGRWKDGGWAVVFVRALHPGRDGEVALDGPGGASVAFAVWDGAAGDRNGQKAVSIWHRLAPAR